MIFENIILVLAGSLTALVTGLFYGYSVSVNGRARATIISEDREKVVSIMEKICLKYLGTLDDPWAKELMKNATDGTYLGIEISPKFFSAYVLGKMEEARSTS
jgi:hypothetical protein